MSANEAGKQKKQSLVDFTTNTDEVIGKLEQDNVQDQTTTTETKATEPEIPEKYKGKSFEELAKMHEEAEKLIGRQGHELGELRRRADEFIFAQLSNINAADGQPKQRKTEVEDEVNFFKDPEGSITKIVENHPAVKEARMSVAEIKAHRSKEALENAHKDYVEVISNPKFQDWVKSSRIRTEMFVRADRNFDFEAADELLSTWKALNNKQVTSTMEAELVKEKREREIKAAGVTSGGGDAPVQGGKGKFIRRADIIDLMRKDPERYEALSAEIRKAYAEGRVR